MFLFFVCRDFVVNVFQFSLQCSEFEPCSVYFGSGHRVVVSLTFTIKVQFILKYLVNEWIILCVHTSLTPVTKLINLFFKYTFLLYSLFFISSQPHYYWVEHLFLASPCTTLYLFKQINNNKYILFYKYPLLISQFSTA